MKKNLFSFSGAVFSLFFAQSVFSQVSIRSGTSISATIPTSATDYLRVDKGTFSQKVSGTVGQFGTADQWIRIGQPSPAVYGTRIQWNQQAFTNYLSPRSGSAVKDAVVAWGNQGGELQFRYLNDAQTYTKILALTSRGNAYMGVMDSLSFNNPKFLINTPGQLALAIKGSGATAASIINVSTNEEQYNLNQPSLSVRSIAQTNDARTDGIVSRAEGGSTNFGITGIAQEGSNYNLGVFGLAKNAQINGIGIQGQADGPNNNYGVYGIASGGVTNWAGYFEGNVFTSGVFTGSDKKLKRDIKAEESVMDKIKSLKPVNYNYKSGEFKTLNLPKNLQHGFIAQDIKEIFPEMVANVTDPTFNKDRSVKNEEFLAINYNMLIPVLTKGLQEQQEYIEKLERRLSDLENTVQKNSDPKVKDDYESLKNISLNQNIPNPFNQKTTISYNIPSRFSNASVVIFDLNGKLLLQYDNLKGKSQIAIEGNKLSAGMYIYSLLINGKEMTSKKMILTK